MAATNPSGKRDGYSLALVVPRQESEAMVIFEYTTVFFGQESAALAELNALAGEGWRLTHVVPATPDVNAPYLILERPVTSAPI